MRATIDVPVGEPLRPMERARLAVSWSVVFSGRPEWSAPRVRRIVISDVPLDEHGRPSENGRVGGFYQGTTITIFRPDLDHSFDHPVDGCHTAIHEFAHAVDGEALRGFPFTVHPADQGAWIATMDEVHEAVRNGRSPLPSASVPTRHELFATAVEHFFERPQELRQAHGALYAMLVDTFRIDPATAMDAAAPTVQPMASLT